MDNLTTEEHEYNQLQEVENQYWAELAEALNRLEDNEDFKRLILEFYFKERPADITSMLAHQYTIENNARSQLMEELVGIGRLHDMFRVVKAKGEMPEYEDVEE